MRVGDPPVGGRYSLVEPFGVDERFAGGQVQTWRARDTMGERDVVLRVITPGGNSARLFLDRALEMSLIAHPGLGMVYEAVDHGDYAIVVCEWIEGTSLADTLKAHGPLTPPTARQTLGAVADAITVAHQVGLPIGGITAERVVLRDNASVTVTAVPALFADERGDIQQLGELLYAALTGERPDLGDPDFANKLHRGVPRDLAVLCQRALDTDPARALGSAAAFAAVLRPRSRPPSAPGGTAGQTAGQTAGRTGGRLGGLDPEPPRRTHDTSPARLPQPGAVRASDGPDSPETTPRALPLPAVAIPAESADQPVPAIDPGYRAASSWWPGGGRSSDLEAGTAEAGTAEADADTDAGTDGRGWGGGILGRPVTEIPPGTGDSAGRSPAEDPSTARIPLGGTAPEAAASLAPAASSPFDPSSGESSGESSGRSSDAGQAMPTAGLAPTRDLTDDLTYGSTDDPTSGSAKDAAQDYDPWLDDTGTWGSYDDSDAVTGGSEGSQTRRKVLLYAVPLAALLLVVLLGVVVGKQFSAVVTDSDTNEVVPSAESTATGATPTEAEATDAPTAPVALPPVSAAVFDPFGDGQPENDGDVGLSYDGDVGSAWETLTYQSNPEFGNLKPGVGVIFDLGEERSINAVELATSRPGSAIEVRVGAAPDAALESYPVIGGLDPFSESGSVALAEPVRARFVIVWFVRLVESNGGFKGDLAECRILGT